MIGECILASALVLTVAANYMASAPEWTRDITKKARTREAGSLFLFMCRVTMRVAKIVVETEAFFGRRC